MCATLHSSQATKPLELKASELRHRPLAADRGERTEVAIAERRQRSALGPRSRSSAATYAPCCFATGATPGKGMPFAPSGVCGVANHEDIGMVRDREVWTHEHTPRPIGLGAEPASRRRRHHARRPHDRPRFDALFAERNPGAIGAVTPTLRRTSTPSRSSGDLRRIGQGRIEWRQ